MRVLLLLAALAASSTVSRAQPLPVASYPDGYDGVRTTLAAQGYDAPVPGERTGRSRLRYPCPDPVYCRRLFQGAGGLVVGTAGAVLFGTLFFDTLAVEGSGAGAAIKLPILAFTGTLAAVSAGGAAYSGVVLVDTLREGPEPHRQR